MRRRSSFGSTGTDDSRRPSFTEPDGGSVDCRGRTRLNENDESFRDTDVTTPRRVNDPASNSGSLRTTPLLARSPKTLPALEIRDALTPRPEPSAASPTPDRAPRTTPGTVRPARVPLYMSSSNPAFGRPRAAPPRAERPPPSVSSDAAPRPPRPLLVGSSGIPPREPRPPRPLPVGSSDAAPPRPDRAGVVPFPLPVKGFRPAAA
ncbi:MAG TPA: hypothetical protein VE172_24770 [Stackebrandtia sp.]|uniref:hypothetical protein n=1 Tax=Stackebrandtia sp. TaxID=2023065 RepID=UPI002D287D2D|nr:hypothetical protein [Stackebrandtia sp.]HZE42022.1 hypothetical protein [Stackebrandtia sp.]